MLMDERQRVRMSKITNDCLTQSGTRCFIAVPVWQQWAWKSQCVERSVWCRYADSAGTGSDIKLASRRPIPALTSWSTTPVATSRCRSVLAPWSASRYASWPKFVLAFHHNIIDTEFTAGCVRHSDSGRDCSQY